MLAIAHALETHKTLTGEDVEAVIEGREGLTSTAGCTATRSSSSSLEDYHAAAAGAHRGHTSVKLALPAGRAPGPAGGGGGRHGGGHRRHPPSPYEPPR